MPGRKKTWTQDLIRDVWIPDLTDPNGWVNDLGWHYIRLMHRAAQQRNGRLDITFAAHRLGVTGKTIHRYIQKGFHHTMMPSQARMRRRRGRNAPRSGAVSPTDSIPGQQQEQYLEHP